MEMRGCYQSGITDIGHGDLVTDQAYMHPAVSWGQPIPVMISKASGSLTFLWWLPAGVGLHLEVDSLGF